MLKDIQSLNFEALNWFNAAQDRSQWSDLGPSVLSRSAVSVRVVGSFENIDSFACGCGRILHRSGDLTRHQWFCGGQPPQQSKQIFNCGRGRIFRRQGDLT